MAEWHVTPDYIINNWTDELFSLMVDKLVERKQKETEQLNKGKSSTVSTEILAARSHGMIEVKHGN